MEEHDLTDVELDKLISRSIQKRREAKGREIRKSEEFRRMQVVYNEAKAHEDGLSYIDLLNKIIDDLGNYAPLSIQLALENGMIAQSVKNGTTWIEAKSPIPVRKKTKITSSKAQREGGHKEEPTPANPQKGSGRTLTIVEQYETGGITRGALKKKTGSNGNGKLNVELRRLLQQDLILIEEGSDEDHDLIVATKYA